MSRKGCTRAECGFPHRTDTVATKRAAPKATLGKNKIESAVGQSSLKEKRFDAARCEVLKRSVCVLHITQAASRAVLQCETAPSVSRAYMNRV